MSGIGRPIGGLPMAGAMLRPANTEHRQGRIERKPLQTRRSEALGKELGSGPAAEARVLPERDAVNCMHSRPRVHSNAPLTVAGIALRSLYPLAAIVLLALLPLVGAVTFLIATFVWWRVVTRIG